MRSTVVTKVANGVISEKNIDNAPVDIKSIIESYGIKLVEKELDNSESGFLFKNKNKTVIAINKTHPNGRQRFTMAHELGHFLLHCKNDTDDHVFIDKAETYNRNKVSSYGIDSNEVEANLFAAMLLMPEKIIAKEIERLSNENSYDVISDLAELFSVSEHAMSIRLQRLGYDILPF